MGWTVLQVVSTHSTDRQMVVVKCQQMQTMCQGKEIGGGMSTNNVSFSLSEIGSAMIDVEESTCVLICISHPRTQYIWVAKLYLKSVPAVFLPWQPPHELVDCIYNSWRTWVGHQRQIPLDLHTRVDPFSSGETTLDEKKKMWLTLKWTIL